MGNSGAKTTNNLLDTNRQNSYNLENQTKDYGTQDRGYQTGVRDFETGAYKDLYNSVGSYTGGGGVPALNLPALRDNEAMTTYRNFMNTGGYSDADVNDYRLRASSTTPAIYQGLKDQMTQAANVRGGGYAGYSGQMAKAAREGSQQAAADQNDAEIKLQDSIRANKLQGASGVSSLDAQRMAEEEQRAREQQSMAASAAAAGRGNNEQAFRDKMSILDAMNGLRSGTTTDMNYLNMASGNNAQAQNAITSRVATPSPFQTVAGVVGGLAGAATPFLGPATKLLGGSSSPAGIPSSNDWAKYTGAK